MNEHTKNINIVARLAGLIVPANHNEPLVIRGEDRQALAMALIHVLQHIAQMDAEVINLSDVIISNRL